MCIHSTKKDKENNWLQIIAQVKKITPCLLQGVFNVRKNMYIGNSRLKIYFDVLGLQMFLGKIMQLVCKKNENKYNI